MTTTPRPSLAEENVDVILNFALANPSDVGDLGGLTVGEIDVAVRYARRAVNTFDEAKAALQAIVLTDTKRVGITVNPHILYCEAVAKAKAVLARMSG